MKIARVFPKTDNHQRTYTDIQPPMLALPEIDEVHISVTFTWDIPIAGRMAKRGSLVPVKVGPFNPASARTV